LGQFGNQTGAPALSHFGGKLPHGLRRDDAAFAPGESRSRIVEGGQKRHAAAFPFLPQRQRFLDGFSLALQPPVFHRSPGEGFLIGRKLHFHVFGSFSQNTLSNALRAPVLAGVLTWHAGWLGSVRFHAWHSLSNLDAKVDTGCLLTVLGILMGRTVP
jgi:hypothetical protein